MNLENTYLNLNITYNPVHHHHHHHHHHQDVSFYLIYDVLLCCSCEREKTAPRISNSVKDDDADISPTTAKICNLEQEITTIWGV